MTETHNMKRQSIKYGWEWPKSRKDFEELNRCDYSEVISFTLAVKKQADGKYFSCGATIGFRFGTEIFYGH